MSKDARTAEGGRNLVITEVDGLSRLWDKRPRSVAASDAVHGTLRQAIVEGVLEPGARLAEEDLARRFDVSRTPVREALLRLESEQFAERVPRRGLVVATITQEAVLDLYVVRQAVDSQAARLAARYAAPPEVAELRWLNGQIRTAAERRDFATMAALNIEFHESLCEVGRSPLLLYFMKQVHDRVRRYPGTTFSHGTRAAEAVAEHDALIDAVERHDEDAAGRIAHEHMGKALAVRVAMLDPSRERVAQPS
jgi:DNA-binding GntR family transcriptional regulator